MSITFGIKDMEFDSEHILEDFRDMYDNERLIVIFEVISNSIDVDATKVELKLRQNALGQYELSFLDNGPGMNEKRFEDFQVAGRSSKTKGFSLGFAGIGAKLPGIDSRISVETFDGKNTYACDFFIENKKMKVQNRKPTEHFTKPGTFYKLTFSDKNYYNFLEKSLEPEIIQTFNNAMLNGLDITINNKKIKPWRPSSTEKHIGKFIFNPLPLYNSLKSISTITFLASLANVFRFPPVCLVSNLEPIDINKSQFCIAKLAPLFP